MPLYFQYSHHQQLYSALVERLKRINRRETEKPFQTAEAGETNTAVKQGCVRTCSIRTYMNGYTYQEFIVLLRSGYEKRKFHGISRSSFPPFEINLPTEAMNSWIKTVSAHNVRNSSSFSLDPVLSVKKSILCAFQSTKYLHARTNLALHIA